MLSFIVTALFSGVVYLLLTAGSGPVLRLWSSQELLVAVVVAVAVGFVSRQYFASARRRAASNPLRWLQGFAYVLGPFFLEMAKANLDVAYRVITGRIRPGIVRVKSGMQTDLGTLMLANSITLTPGTLTADISADGRALLIHCLDAPDPEAVRDDIKARYESRLERIFA